MQQDAEASEYKSISWLTSISRPGPHSHFKLRAASSSLPFLASQEGLSDTSTNGSTERRKTVVVTQAALRQGHKVPRLVIAITPMDPNVITMHTVKPLNFGSASSSASTCLGTIIQQTVSKFRVVPPKRR
ncbi:hypothetical protein B7P43_G11479 [Cryptotermes secundus]|uniref:Uncharacterized protein n=1 Tax=Cryptotermes secundus TaxID=105785 RepID=A0A2J7PC23_9NEOP|nr:hypothetical protein B7P43_G11479 [Cryptotermes secundus]